MKSTLKILEEKIWKIKCFVINVKKQQDVQDVQNLEYVENHQNLARLQDLLIYTTKGLSEVTTRLREEGKRSRVQDVNHLITINLFTTITNANFDDEVFYAKSKRNFSN